MDDQLKRRVSLIGINAIMAALSLFLAAFTIFEVVLNSSRYAELERTSSEYASYVDTAAGLSEASDFLTTEVRKFVNFKDKKYLDEYFNEATVAQRREKALDVIREKFGDSEITRRLSSARNYSEQLEEIEYYAMRLVVEGMKYDLEEYPDEIKNVELSNGDMAVESFSQLAVAINMVTNEEYETYKSKIRENATMCVQMIYEEAMNAQAQISEKTLKSIRLQEIFIFLLIAVIVATAVMNIVLMFRPLRKSEEAIRRGEKIAMKGSREMQFFAAAYNRIFEKNVKRSEQLSYESTHDGLTGLLNRTAFDKAIEEENWSRVALLIVDVDGFKTIDDTYRHSTGDAVLRLVAETLLTTFRADDRVYRLGGDEFAVVMIGAGHEQEETIRQKYREMQAKTEEKKEEFYGATLSVGAAFGNWITNSQDIFKKADTLLYEVKKHGKNNIKIETR